MMSCIVEYNGCSMERDDVIENMGGNVEHGHYSAHTIKLLSSKRGRSTLWVLGQQAITMMLSIK